MGIRFTTVVMYRYDKDEEGSKVMCIENLFPIYDVEMQTVYFRKNGEVVQTFRLDTIMDISIGVFNGS